MKSVVEIDYTDKQGKRWKRRIEPVEGGIHFNYRDGSVPEWFIVAIDVDGGGALKTFSMQQIHAWIDLPPAGVRIVRPPAPRP